MTRTPLAIRSALISPSGSALLTSLPLPVPSSVGSLSLMMRADTSVAPGAMPPANSPTALPAAISDTQVPWPTTSSVVVLFCAGSM